MVLTLTLFLFLAVAPPTEASTEDASLRFVDTAETWGLDFRHHHGGRDDFFMIETMGSGVVAFDYDGDGDDDLLFVDSGQPEPYGGSPGRTTLLRNDLAGERGVFVDMTDASGIRLDSYGMGAVTGDLDGDGDFDLYLTAFGPNRLLLNQGDGSFRAAAVPGAAADPSWSASAALGDLDLDGDLDLYVTNYVDFRYDDNKVCGEPERGRRSYCHPDVYNGLADRLYRNDSDNGSATFVDATAEAGLEDVARGAGLGVAITDLDGDRKPDIYVANDMDPNLHLLNRGGSGELRFEDHALLAGTAMSGRGEAEAGMGVAIGDVDGNGFDDLIVTHLDRQTNALYANRGDGVFLDRRYAAGIAEPSLPWVGFGLGLGDFDLDGDLDLAVANGHVSHNVDERRNPDDGLAQPNQLLENDGGRFSEIEHSGMSAIRTSRGLAAADFDLDGDLDVVVSNNNDRAEAYRNETKRRGDGLWIALMDRQSSNQQAVGAVLELHLGGAIQRRVVRAGSSYLSQHSLTQTFAVPGAEADAAQADRPTANGRTAQGTTELQLDVRWPDGRRLRLQGPFRDRRLRLVR